MESKICINIRFDDVSKQIFLLLQRQFIADDIQRKNNSPLRFVRLQHGFWLGFGILGLLGVKDDGMRNY